MTTVDHDDTNGGAAARPNMARSAARLNAVQALYQLAISGGTPENAIDQFIAAGPAGRTDGDEQPVADADHKLFADLVRGTRANVPRLDEMLAQCLNDAWPAERMEVLLRAILRCGAYELLSQPTVPARVVISEYVRVADAFFAGKEPPLVNAVLDRLGRILRPAEWTAPDSGR